MSDLGTLIEVAMLGGAVGVGLFTICFLTLWAYDLKGYIKDDISRVRKLHAFFRLYHKHIYHQTDWAVVPKAVVGFVLVGVVGFAISFIFLVGLMELAA